LASIDSVDAFEKCPTTNPPPNPAAKLVVTTAAATKARDTV
jgi:hypothetical protein